ncbi:hypothetical protein HO173_007682 [Letharia columbiana]|uniref:Uncharacterized protein n=1 Tax=Letharia columbiana TaxID=112416 RepID=A0A8H6FT71_9LECA|nr:uncharacterized protein HO173_007682 [Letharia columbiana]KAF6234260.1 hypothetical protein HO173_007682 [Letharia columbiana]
MTSDPDGPSDQGVDEGAPVDGGKMTCEGEVIDVVEGAGKEDVVEGPGKEDVVEGAGKEDVVEGAGKEDVVEGAGKEDVVEGTGKEDVEMTDVSDEKADLADDEDNHERGVLRLVGGGTEIDEEVPELPHNGYGCVYECGHHNEYDGDTRKSAVGKPRLGPSCPGCPSAGLLSGRPWLGCSAESEAYAAVSTKREMIEWNLLAL